MGRNDVDLPANSLPFAHLATRRPDAFVNSFTPAVSRLPVTASQEFGPIRRVISSNVAGVFHEVLGVY
jgi:hypothetical protein